MVGRVCWCLLLVLACAAGAARAGEAPAQSEADLQFEFAEKLFEIQVYKTAAAEYVQFLKDYAEDARREEARYKLAICYFKLGGEKEEAKALGELATLRKEFPNGERIQDCLFYSAYIRYVKGDSKGAIVDLGELGKLPVRADLQVPMNHFLGRSYYDLGQLGEAVKFLGLVAKAPKENELRRYALILLADARFQMRDYAESAWALEALLADYPDLPARDEMWLKLGDVRVVTGEHDKALAAYSRAGPEARWKAEVGKARALLGLKKYAEATAAAAKVMAEAGERDAGVRDQCQYLIGLALFDQGRYAEGAEHFSRLLEKVQQGPIAEEVAFKLCWCYYGLGAENARNLVASCVEFRRLFPASTRGGEVIFLTGEGFLRLGDYDNAIAYYRQVGEKDANYADALYRTAYCYHKQKKSEEAGRAYDVFAEKFVRHENALSAVAAAGGVYQAAEKFKEAIERYDRYLAAAPQGPEAEGVAYQRGVCFARLKQFGDMAAAFAAYTKAYPKGKYAGEAWRWLGRYHRVQGDELAEKGDADGATAAYVRAREALRSGAALDGPERDETLVASAECDYNLGLSLAGRAAATAAKAKAAGAPEKEQLEKESFELEKQSESAFKSAAEGFLDLIGRRPELIKQEAVYVWTGTWFRQHRDAKSAIRVFRALAVNLKTSERADTALYQLAALHGELDPPDNEPVISHVDELLQRFPGSLLALQAKYVKAEALWRRNAADAEAEKLYTEVARAGDGAIKAGSIMKLGHMNFVRKNYAEGVRYFAEVGLLYNDEALSAEALYFAGKANALLGVGNEAAKFWRELVKRYPGSRWAAEARRELTSAGLVPGPETPSKKE